MREYCDLVDAVLNYGKRKPNRTGVDTLSVFGAFYGLHLGNGLPLLTTKRVNWDACLHELLWQLSGEDHIRNLQKHTHIWDAWADADGNLETAYGKYWRKFPTPRGDFDQIQWIIDELKRNPWSRRLVLSAWEPSNATSSKLPPCPYTLCFNVSPGEDGKPFWLNCHLTQRSGDLALGIPFDVAQYSALTMMIAQEVNLLPGTFAHTIVDAHIYVNHVDGLREQLTRIPRPLPRLVIAQKPFAELTFDDFILQSYDPYPAISFKVAV